ncbi:MAG: mechanosensitive ion channel family protein [Gammaproteobacteria bacterium]
MENINAAALQRAMDMGLDLAINLGIALAIFVVGRWAARLVANGISRLLERRGVDAILVSFLGNVVYVGTIVFVVVAALGQLGIQTASFVAIIGAAGLAIALAFQGSLSNLASGVLLVTFRPFKVGDFIEAGGTSGVVERLDIFTTQVRTGDNKTIIVPNSAISGGTIVNYSTKPTRRLDLVVGVGYDVDLDKVRTVLEDILSADERVLSDPAPTIGVTALADSSVNFVVRPWCASGDYWPLHFTLHETIKKRFDAEGISIPFPQRDVHLHQVA